MQRTSRSGTGGEYLLRENIVREILRNMYNAFDSTVNSRLLVEKMPGEITEGEFRGDDKQRWQMKMLCEWLHAISMITKDDEIYQATFLDPVRAVAHARLKMAEMDTRSTSIEALVFASKPYYDKVYKTSRIMMSVVAPCLQTAMTISVTSRGEENIHYGYCGFDYCQPMPLVNRIHQTKGMVHPSQRQINLEEFDYLYTALNDIQFLGRSLEMENFCEVPSTSADKDRRLAAPFVTFGKVVRVDGPSVRVRELNGSNQVTMMAVNQTAVLSRSPLENFKGKTVRILGVQWYEPGSQHDQPPDHPAIYCIETDDSVDTLRIQEECGKVRLRGGVHFSKIPVNLREGVTALHCIRTTEKNVSYVYRRSSDKVVSYFLDAQRKVRELRIPLKTNAVQVTEDQVIDRRKSGVEGLAKLAMSKKFRKLGIALMDFIAQNDIYHEYGNNMVCRALEMTPEDRRRQMSFLTYLKIMKKGKEGDWSLTKRGKDVAMKVALNFAGNIPPMDLPAVLSPDSLVDKCIPPSLALNMIRGGVLGKYEPGRIKNTTTETHWIKGGMSVEAKNESQLVENYTSLIRHVLSIMGDRDNPLGAAKIVELLGDRSRASTFTIDLLLDELSKGKAGKVSRNGDTWEYPVMMRVLDLFDCAKDEIIYEEDVTKKINVATSPARRSEVGAAIAALVREGKVTHRGNGFISSSHLKAKKDVLVREIIGLFEHERGELLSESDVAKKIEGGEKWRFEIRAVIDALVRDSTIVQIDQDKFTHNSEIKAKEDIILRARLKKVALGMFSSVDVDENDMISALVEVLDDSWAEGNWLDKTSYARSVLNEMEDDGHIWLNRDRYVKGDV